MATPQKVHIGILSPATANRPHFKSLEQMLPPEVTVTNEGLGLLQNSYSDLEGKTGEIAARAADFVRRNKVHGLIVTGGFVTLFNPGLEAKVAEAVQIPVTSAVPSVTAALHALSVTRVMLVTPFTTDMNAHIEKHLTNLGFTVFPGPPYDKTRKPGAGVEISPDELFQPSRIELPGTSDNPSHLLPGRHPRSPAGHSTTRRQPRHPGCLQQHRNDLEHPVEARREVFDRGLRQIAIGVAKTGRKVFNQGLRQITIGVAGSPKD